MGVHSSGEERLVHKPMERFFPSPTKGEGRLPRLAKGQVDALAAHQGVLAVGKRGDAVEEQPRRSAPYHDIAMLQPVAARFVGRARLEGGLIRPQRVPP